MTDNIKLPPYPEGLCLREDIEDYAREAVRLNAQADNAPAGSGGWESHAKELERELTYWRQRAKTMLEYQQGECWHWQGDGTDHPESMVNSLPVVIRADELRALMAPAAPQPAQQPLTDERLRQMHHEDEFGLFCDYDDFEQIARAIEQAHGIGAKND
jgi:hypothetical protein